MNSAIPARHGEASTAPEPRTDADVQLVVCVVGDERYGLAVGRVHEIIRSIAITALPGADRSFNGVINLRGRIIPVMDLRRRFGLPEVPATRFTRIVVADAAGTRVGLVVDAVHEVVRMAPTTIERAPALTASTAVAPVTGIARAADGLIILLDLERLVIASTPDLADVTAPGASA